MSKQPKTYILTVPDRLNNATPAKGEDLPDTLIDVDAARAGIERLFAEATPTPGRKPADKVKAGAKAAARTSFAFTLGLVDDVPDVAVCEETATYATTYLALGERTLRHFGRWIAWCPEIKAWRVFTGQRWVIDKDGTHVLAMIFATMRAISVHEAAWAERKSEAVIEAQKVIDKYTEAGLPARTEDEQALKAAKQVARKDIEDFGRRCEDAANAITTAMKYLRTKTMKHESVWDKHKLLVNAPNGTYHVGKREFREHWPEDHITRMTKANIVPGAPITADFQKVLDHLDRQVRGNSIMMLRWSGMALTKVTDAKAIVAITGPANGAKSTWFETFLEVSNYDDSCGYGAAVTPESLATTATRSGNGHQDALDRLADRVWCYMDECQGVYFDTEKLKTMAAGGKQTTSAKGGSTRTWTSHLAMAIIGNGGFKFPAYDTAFLFRLLPIDYECPIPDSEMDEQLKHRLLEEEANHESMLWACLSAGSDWYEAYQDGRAEGVDKPARAALNLPENIAVVRAAFGAGASPLTAWLEDRVIVGDDADLQAEYGQFGKAESAVWLAYYNACAKDFGRKPLPDGTFFDYLNALGHTLGNPTDVTYRHSKHGSTIRMKGKRVRTGMRFRYEADWFAFMRRYVEHDRQGA